MRTGRVDVSDCPCGLAAEDHENSILLAQQTQAAIYTSDVASRSCQRLPRMKNALRKTGNKVRMLSRNESTLPILRSVRFLHSSLLAGESQPSKGDLAHLAAHPVLFPLGFEHPMPTVGKPWLGLLHIRR